MMMPLLIAHRGLLDGPDPDLENAPSSIELARKLGHDVEIDVWYTDGGWFLGHDFPQYRVSLEWISKINRSSYLDQHHAWIHAKNIDAIGQLRQHHWEGHIFFHQDDEVVMTSTGYIWSHYRTSHMTRFSVCVMPEWNGAIDTVHTLDIHGICTDYIRKVEKNLSNK